MAFYLLTYFFSIIFAVIYDIAPSRYLKKIFFTLCLLVLCFPFLIRAPSIGMDTMTYLDIFRDISLSDNLIGYSLITNMEIGFVLVVRTIQIFTTNYSIIFFLLSFLIFIPYFYSIKKFKFSLTIMVICLLSFTNFYLMSFNILRQSLALSIVVLASIFLVQHKKNNYYLCSVLAFLFHYSAIISFSFILIYKYRNIISKYWYLMVLSSATLSLFFLNLIANNYERYSNYVEKDTVAEKSGVLLFLMLNGILVISIFAKKFIDKKYVDFYSFLISLYSIYIGLSLFYQFTSITNQGVNRMTFYFLWPAIFLILIPLKSIRNLDFKVASYLLIIAFLSFFAVFTLAHRSVDTIPFIIDNKFIQFF